MGWLSMPRSSMGGYDTPNAYLDAQFTYARTLEDGSIKALRVLASSCLRNQVYYAAVEPSLGCIPRGRAGRATTRSSSCPHNPAWGRSSEKRRSP